MSLIANKGISIKSEQQKLEEKARRKYPKCKKIDWTIYESPAFTREIKRIRENFKEMDNENNPKIKKQTSEIAWKIWWIMSWAKCVAINVAMWAANAAKWATSRFLPPSQNKKR